MPERGDVVRLRRPIGFGSRAPEVRFVVMSPAKLNAMFPTFMGVPMYVHTAVDRGVPGNVIVRAADAGSDVDLVAVACQLAPVRTDDLEPGVRSHVSPITMQAIENAIRLVLGFRA